MFKLENGKKLMAKHNVYGKNGYKIFKGDTCTLKEFFFDMDIEKGDESVHLMLFDEKKEQAYHVEINVEALDLFFEEVKYSNIKKEYIIEELQAAYNAVMMKENGYSDAEIFPHLYEGSDWQLDSITKHSTQVDKDLYQSNLKSLIEEIEAFNNKTFKECAINVALDTGNKEMFMQLTGGN